MNFLRKNFKNGENNSQFGMLWWTNIETFEQVKSKTCPGINYVRGRKTLHKENKKKILSEKRQYAIDNGLLRSDGHVNGKGKTLNEWIERKNLILNSGVNLTKFGWVGKVINATGLTKRIIENTVKRFAELQHICFNRNYK